jgi:hypothetical protein
MSSAELAEHAGYVSDPPKLEGYEQALDRLLGPGEDVVLDLDLADGSRSTDEVMEAVRAALPPETPAPVVDKVRGALERFSEPMDSAR